MNKWTNFLKKYKFGILILLFSLIFSSWLMFSTFSYKDGGMLIAGKAWSDFGSHIPLIRSFSLGDNFPIQYPLFPGEPIKYHFLFYALVGLFERMGIRIDYALNLPSAMGFTFLLVMIYLLAKKIFNSIAVGILSVIFFMFNGSLSFFYFFQKHPFSLNTINEIISNQTFPSFGPYDHTSIISAFWNLNIYTNQRHLALSLALSLFIIYLFLNFEFLSNKRRALLKSTLIGVLLGTSFLLNMAVFLMTIAVLLSLFLFMKKERIYIFISLLIAFSISFPIYKYITLIPSTFNFTAHLGYLVENLNIFNFLNYWFQNLGLHLVLIPAALLIATKFQRKIFLAFFALFIIGNLIQFSPEIAANHKFFNYFMVIGVMFSSYVLVYLWKKRNILKPIMVVLIFFLTLSGIIDFFPILNDGKISLQDRSDKDVQWIVKNTPPDSVFLNSDYFMDKANIAGRKTFLGWPYFAWSQGYDTNSRDITRKEMLNSKTLDDFCEKTKNYKLNYFEINMQNKYDFPINYDLFKNNLKLLYSSNDKNYAIYDIRSSCR